MTVKLLGTARDQKERVWLALQRAAERIGQAEHAAGRYKVTRRKGRVVQGYSISEAHRRVIDTMDALGRDKITSEQAMAVLHEYEVFQARTARDAESLKRNRRRKAVAQKTVTMNAKGLMSRKSRKAVKRALYREQVNAKRLPCHACARRDFLTEASLKKHVAKFHTPGAKSPRGYRTRRDASGEA